MLMNHVKQPNPSSTSCLKSLLTRTARYDDVDNDNNMKEELSTEHKRFP